MARRGKARFHQGAVNAALRWIFKEITPGTKILNYSKEEIEKIQKLILGNLLNTSSPPSFDEKDRLVEGLKTANEIIEREINDLAINN